MTLKKHYKRRFRLIGLRGKLLLTTLSLLIFPLAGFSYLKELELFLKNNHSESVVVIAKTIASVFRDNGSLISLNQLVQSPQKAFYSHSLPNEVIIDGYSDDWFALQNKQHYFKLSPVSSDHAMELLCANNEQFYYFLLTVYQQKYHPGKSLGMVGGSTEKHPDIFVFQYLDYSHNIQEYRFKLDSPGWVRAYPENSLSLNANQQIHSEWQQNSQGYTLEFKIPAGNINQHIAFQLQQSTGETKPRIFTSTESLMASLGPAYQLNPLVSSDPLSVLRLKHLVPDNTQLWLLNNQHYVSARAKKTLSAYDDSEHNFSFLSLYRRLYLAITDFPEQKTFYGSNQAQINNEAITKTLEGKTTAVWLDNPHSDQLILSVATPVYDNERNVIGALLLEQSNNALLTLQDNTFERMLFLTIVLFFSVALTLLFFSTRLLKRIINLRNDTDRALSQKGEIINQLYRNDNDEIGDLARSFSTLLSRLEMQNQYLKTLSSKLSHELRTPLTIIKSSLESMSTLSLSNESHQRFLEESHQQFLEESPQRFLTESKKYALRAIEGCDRLNDLLNRMSEASRLEQSIDTMEMEAIEIVNFLRNYTEAIQAANPDLHIVFNTSIRHQIINFSPELIAQLLDKLFANAISYHTLGTTITLALGQQNKKIIIELSNYGVLIDDNKLDSIFNSLTSYRQKKNQQVHLGLGLYIANLISKYHNGRLEVKNNKREQSVCFILILPI